MGRVSRSTLFPGESGLDTGGVAMRSERRCGMRARSPLTHSCWGQGTGTAAEYRRGRGLASLRGRLARRLCQVIKHLALHPFHLGPVPARHEG